MTHAISLSILILLLWGRRLAKKNLNLHVRVMSITIALDVSLVIYLSFGKKVLHRIPEKMSTLLMIHIAMALSVVVLYFFTIAWGRKLLKGQQRDLYLNKMRWADRWIVGLRTAVFVTSLYLSYAPKSWIL